MPSVRLASAGTYMVTIACSTRSISTIRSPWSKPFRRPPTRSFRRGRRRRCRRWEATRHGDTRLRSIRCGAPRKHALLSSRSKINPSGGPTSRVASSGSLPRTTGTRLQPSLARRVGYGYILSPLGWRMLRPVASQVASSLVSFSRLMQLLWAIVKPLGLDSNRMIIGWLG